MERISQVKRKTTETDVTLKINIDGSGKYSIKTPVPFLTHMLELFSKHGLFDLEIIASGDIEIDFHHTVEDIGICLGEAFNKALGKKEKIKRYGEAKVPMDEALAQITLDISGRPHLTCNIPQIKDKVGHFDTELVEEFFQAFVNNSGITLHINLISGKNSHHIIEAVFKAFARALDAATLLDPRVSGIPSTKGAL
jgi:imidazoleglycerol-phosphate dehydratase